jgi:hypothetical protein
MPTSPKTVKNRKTSLFRLNKRSRFGPSGKQFHLALAGFQGGGLFVCAGALIFQDNPP